MSKKNLYLVAGLIFGGCFGLFYYWSSQPSYSVVKAGYAIATKNRSIFDKSVHLEKVADGLADDTVSNALKKLGADPLGNAGLVQSALALKMVESLKPQLVQYVFKTVDSYFMHEPIVNSSGQSLNSVLLMLLASQSDLKFSWHLATEKNLDFAIVTLGFVNQRTLKPISIRMRLEKDDQGWKIVRMYNVVESLADNQ